MLDTLIIQNVGQGQVAFIIYPPVTFGEGMPKHKRRKALRDSLKSISIPPASSLDLVAATGIPSKELRMLPEVLTILSNHNVRVLEPETVKAAPAPVAPVEAPVEAPEAVVEPAPVPEAPLSVEEPVEAPEAAMEEAPAPVAPVEAPEIKPAFAMPVGMPSTDSKAKKKK